MPSTATPLAGAALDELVAVQVMGWKRLKDSVDGLVVHRLYLSPKGMETSWLPPFSANIAHAWEVVERLREFGFTITITIGRDLGPAMVRVEGLRIGYGMSQASTASLAICRAALDATANS